MNIPATAVTRAQSVLQSAVAEVEPLIWGANVTRLRHMGYSYRQIAAIGECSYSRVQRFFAKAA